MVLQIVRKNSDKKLNLKNESWISRNDLKISGKLNLYDGVIVTF